MTSSTSALRRWWGVFCLGVGSGMLIWGRTVLQPHLEGSIFVVYWCVFAASTSVAIGFGMADFLAERSRLKTEQAELQAQAMTDLKEAEAGGPGELVEQRQTPSSRPASQDR